LTNNTPNLSDSSRRRARSWPYERHEAYERRLRDTAARWFASRGHPVQSKYPYILAEWDRWPENIILPDVADYIAETRRDCEARSVPFPLHKYIHHGLSSQAMLFNLVGPMVVRRDLAPLQTAFAAAGIPWPGDGAAATFEVEDRAVFNEGSGQPTSIDLVIAGDGSALGLYVEAKMVEREFGGCSVFEQGDCDGMNPAADPSLCYLHYIGRGYWQRMAEHGGLQGALIESPVCLMAGYYQFFRELLFAVHKGGTFVLLYDCRNPTFVRGETGGRGLWPFLVSLLPDALRARVKSVTMQEVFDAVKATGRHYDWTPSFAEKYGL
jgi:POLQ-like helicase